MEELLFAASITDKKCCVICNWSLYYCLPVFFSVYLFVWLYFFVFVSIYRHVCLALSLIVIASLKWIFWNPVIAIIPFVCTPLLVFSQSILSQIYFLKSFPGLFFCACPPPLSPLGSFLDALFQPSRSFLVFFFLCNSLSNELNCFLFSIF